MNQADWLACDDSWVMLYYLLGGSEGLEGNHSLWKISRRKLRLWVGAMFGASTHNYRGMKDVECWQQGDSARYDRDLLGVARMWAERRHDNPGDPSPAVRVTLLRCIVGDPFAPVTRGLGVCPNCRREPCNCDNHWERDRERLGWLTPTVVSVAQAIYEGRDWAALPVLADALEDAGATAQGCIHCAWGEYVNLDPPCGCSTRELLIHLRHRGPHALGCWALDLVLGRQ